MGAPCARTHARLAVATLEKAGGGGGRDTSLRPLRAPACRAPPGLSVPGCPQPRFPGRLSTELLHQQHGSFPNARPRWPKEPPRSTPKPAGAGDAVKARRLCSVAVTRAGVRRSPEDLPSCHGEGLPPQTRDERGGLRSPHALCSPRALRPGWARVCRWGSGRSHTPSTPGQATPLPSRFARRRKRPAKLVLNRLTGQQRRSLGLLESPTGAWGLPSAVLTRRGGHPPTGRPPESRTGCSGWPAPQGGRGAPASTPRGEGAQGVRGPGGLRPLPPTRLEQQGTRRPRGLGLRNAGPLSGDR